MFNKRLKALRNQANKTQIEVADFLGISRTAYNNYESGIREPDNDKIIKLADIFEVSIDFLLGRTDDPTPIRDINFDIDAERDFDAELRELLKDVDGLVAFKDYANMDDASKKEIIQFIKFKKEQEGK